MGINVLTLHTILIIILAILVSRAAFPSYPAGVWHKVAL